MQRDTDSLSRKTYDVVVVGGGIYGACIARDAATRGLSVALLERNDFGAETSHNSLRLIHGGLRYLQHFDIPRIRQSVHEQNYWLWAAPHLIRPLKFMMPTFGIGTRGPAALWCATKLYGLLAFDRNKNLDEASQMASGGLVSLDGLLETIPGLDRSEMNAGAYWYDGQLLDADRLTMDILREASDKGAAIANYAEVKTLIQNNDKVIGVNCYDSLAESEFEVRGRITVCAAGPWTSQMTASVCKQGTDEPTPLSKGLNLVVKSLGHDVAFGVRSARSSDAVVGSSRRMFFATPLPNCSIIGTSHLPFEGPPDECRFTEQDATDFLAEFNAAYPAAQLTPDDVLYWHGGLTPADEAADSEVSRSRHAEIIDHAHRDRVDGLISVIGVKYTTSRLVAENATNLVCRKLDLKNRQCVVSRSKLPNAQPYDATSRFPLYGSVAQELEALTSESGNNPATIFEACCTYALRNEMTSKLEDLLLRRTPNAKSGELTQSMFDKAADLMSRHYEWDEAQERLAVENAHAALKSHGARISS